MAESVNTEGMAVSEHRGNGWVSEHKDRCPSGRCCTHHHLKERAQELHNLTCEANSKRPAVTVDRPFLHPVLLVVSDQIQTLNSKCTPWGSPCFEVFILSSSTSHSRSGLAENVLRIPSLLLLTYLLRIPIPNLLLLKHLLRIPIPNLLLLKHLLRIPIPCLLLLTYQLRIPIPSLLLLKYRLRIPIPSLLLLSVRVVCQQGFNWTSTETGVSSRKQHLA